MHLDHQPYITFAVICKNEAANIERCLASIFKESLKFDAEVLVVDSYSTDGTVELAKNFPVKILQLGQDWPHSPAAGRYTAVRHAKGRFIMIVDGDMELLPGFIDTALTLFESEPSLVAVRGRLHNCHTIDGKVEYIDSDYDGVIVKRSDVLEDVMRETPVANGAALFRLEALREAGNFHPFLRGEEEGEIARRLRAGGGKLIYIPADSVNHYGYLRDPLAEVVRRLRRGMIGAAGQMFRLSLEEGYALSYSKRIYQHIAMAAFFFLAIPALLLAAVFPSAPLIWFLSFTLLILAYWWKKGSLRAALAAFLMKLLIGIDIVRGIFVKLPARESYPTEVAILSPKYPEIRPQSAAS